MRKREIGTVTKRKKGEQIKTNCRIKRREEAGRKETGIEGREGRNTAKRQEVERVPEKEIRKKET
jgi:hypothetical protein